MNYQIRPVKTNYSQRILTFIKQNPRCTVEHLQKAIAVNRDAMGITLRCLEECGVIVRWACKSAKYPHQFEVNYNNQ